MSQTIDDELDMAKLLKYEAPSLSEYIGFGWGQKLVAKYLAIKINRKLKRYNARLAQERWVKKQLAQRGKAV